MPRSTDRDPNACILLSSTLTHPTGYQLQKLVWFHVYYIPHSIYRVHLVFRTVSYTDDTYMPECISVYVCMSKMPPRTTSPVKGSLQCGKPYILYHFSLYADGFKQMKSFSDTISVTGCYNLPLFPSSKSKKSSAAAHVISFVPHVQDAKDLGKAFSTLFQLCRQVHGEN